MHIYSAGGFCISTGLYSYGSGIFHLENHGKHGDIMGCHGMTMAICLLDAISNPFCCCARTLTLGIVSGLA